MLVSRTASNLEMVGVDASAVVAPVSDHLISRRRGPRRHTVDEPVRWQLTAMEPDPPGRLGAGLEAV